MSDDREHLASLRCTNHNTFIDSLLLVRVTAESTNAITHPECVLSSTCPEPFVVPKGGAETTMVWASQRYTNTKYTGGQAWEVGFAWRHSLEATLAGYNSSVVYTPPWAGDVPYGVTQGHFSSFTHREMRAIDYALPRNTPIVAAREGIVIKVVDGHPDGRNCMAGGSWNLDAYPANRVVVLHPDGTRASYVHLESGSMAVKLHSPISRGTLLGASGNSGCSTAPHLHWQVDGHIGGFTVPAEDPDQPLSGPSWAPGFPTQGTIDTDTAWDCTESTTGEPKEGWHMPGIPESAMREPMPIPENSLKWAMPPEEPFRFYVPRAAGCLPVQDPCDPCTMKMQGAEAEAEAAVSLADGTLTCEIQPSGKYGNISAVCCANNATEPVVSSVEVSSSRSRMRDPRAAGHSELEAAAALSGDSTGMSFDVRVMPGASVVAATFGKVDHRAYFRLKVTGIDTVASTEDEMGGRSRGCAVSPPLPPPPPPPVPSPPPSPPLLQAAPSPTTLIPPLPSSSAGSLASPLDPLPPPPPAARPPPPTPSVPSRPDKQQYPMPPLPAMQPDTAMGAPIPTSPSPTPSPRHPSALPHNKTALPEEQGNSQVHHSPSHGRAGRGIAAISAAAAVAALATAALAFRWARRRHLSQALEDEGGGTASKHQQQDNGDALLQLSGLRTIGQEAPAPIWGWGTSSSLQQADAYAPAFVTWCHA